MNNKRKRFDNFSIGFRVSEACTRSALAALIFAAIGFGLAEKLRNLSQYISYGNYILARELLDVGLEDLRADPCWKAYAAENKDESDQITLIQLLGLVCTDSPPVQFRIVEPIAWGQVTVTWDLPTEYEPAPPGTPISKMRPKPPTNVQAWGGVYAAGQIKDALDRLWDDKLIEDARKSSNSAGVRLYRWQLARGRIASKPRVQSESTQKHTRGWAHPELSKLTLADISQVNSAPRVTLEDIDRTLDQNFRAAIPNSSLVVSLSTASIAISLAISLILVVLSGHMRTVRKLVLFKQPGTVFNVFFGSRWSEIIVLITTILPVATLFYLCFSMPTLLGQILVGMATIISVISTIDLLSKMIPVTYMGQIGKRKADNLW